MGIDFNKNGIDDKEDHIIMEELEKDTPSNASIVMPAIVVFAIIVIVFMALGG